MPLRNIFLSDKLVGLKSGLRFLDWSTFGKSPKTQKSVYFGAELTAIFWKHFDNGQMGFLGGI